MLEFATIFLLMFLAQRVALRLLSRGYFQESLQMVFEIVRMTPNLLATLTLFRNKRRAFKVTPKGRVNDERQRIAAPVILYALLALSGVSALWFGLTIAGLTGMTYEEPWAAWGSAFWLAVNAAFIAMAVLRVRSPQFATERRTGVRFNTELDGMIGGAPCRIVDLSLGGALIEVPSLSLVPERAILAIGPGTLNLRIDSEVRIHRAGANGRVAYGLRFTSAHPRDRARIALALFHHDTGPAYELEAIAAD
jgi:cellulose synthase (UDP-forming)